MTKKTGDTRAATLTIELDRPRVLKLDMNSLADIEEVLGVSFFSGGSADPTSIFKDLNVRKIRDIFWALLRHEDPELTKEDVGRMLGLKDLPIVMEAFGDLFVLGMPEAEESDGPLASGGKAKKPAKAG